MKDRRKRRLQIVKTTVGHDMARHPEDTGAKDAADDKRTAEHVVDGNLE